MKNLIVVINTCKQYFTNVKNIIEQINEFNFPKNNILIVSGQEENDETIYYNDIKIIKVKYSGLHHTGAIYINENIKQFENIKYFMFLPDTIKFGKNFFNNVETYWNEYLKNETIQVLGFINPKIRPSMDMCILHTEHVIGLSEYFNKIKTYKTNADNLIKLKKILIFDENCILGTKPVSHYGTNYIKYVDAKLIKFITNDEKLLQETRIENGKINQVYFVLLDLYKFQRNFMGACSKLIITL